MSDNQFSVTDELAPLAPNFRTEIIEKIRQIAEREDQAQQGDAESDLRVSVRKVLEEFQSLIIQRNIWIRIYDDNKRPLPPFDPEAGQAVSELIKSALRRHRTGRMLAYIEISFLINETGTVVTIEDNAPSVTVEELTQFSFLQKTTTTNLLGGFTLQGVVEHGIPGQKPVGHHPVGHHPVGHHPVGHRPVGHRPVGHLSVRCVTGCFTRFGLSLLH